MPPTTTSRQPLGLKPDFAVSRSILATLQYIEQFELGRGRDGRAAKLLGSGSAALEFKRFLALPLLYPGRREYPFVPSLRLDLLWHTFLLDTPRYREFCERVYGQYLDHVPGRSRSETKRAVRLGPMQFTVQSITQAFDGVNRRYWSEAAFCGPCLLFIA